MTAPNKDEDLVEAVLSLCDEIPAGHVVSYGDIAAIAGCGPRQVGKIMSSHGTFTCWWRVVRADGSSAVAEQAVAYWDGEGITHRHSRVDMKRCRYEFPAAPR